MAHIVDLSVSDVVVSLIKPMVIPDLFFEYDKLKPEFSFLGSLDEYSKYYIDLERQPGPKVKFNAPAVLPNLGLLRPLKKKHSMNSFWRYFRLSIEKAKWEGTQESFQELFLLLPLVLNIPIEPIKANKKTFSAETSVLLFPFGSCVVNMNVKVPLLGFADLINLIPSLKRANITPLVPDGFNGKNLAFGNFSHEIVTQIADALFDSVKSVSSFDIHTYIFVRKTSENAKVLSTSFQPYKKAIAAAITGQSFENVESLKDVDNFFSASLEGRRKREILVFNPKGSFFYADPQWQGPISELSIEEREKLRKKARCMRRNYQSNLNILFAVRRFLRICDPSKRANISKEKLDALKKAFSLAFLEDTLRSRYFRSTYQKIAPSIGLDKALKEFCEE